MKRRNFLKMSIPATLAPMLLNNRMVYAFGMPTETDCTKVNDRALVIIQLFGGNDGLNTIIPIDQYNDYINLRPTIGIDQSKLINLDSTLPIQNQVGLHPILSPLKSMYDNGMMSLIQGVGYPNQNGSHFSSTDFWMTGGDGTLANSNIKEGWGAKYLTEAYPGRAGNLTLSTHPLAIQVGSINNSKIFFHKTEQGIVLNLTGQDPGGFYSIISSITGTPPSSIPNSEHGDQLRFILDVENNANGYSQTVQSSFNNGTNHTSVTYPNTSLANQLKTVAKLISGGLKTKVYHVRMGGFDTHSNQAVGGMTDTGTHADLLKILAEAVKAFHDDINAQGFGDNVLSTTISEFGRKIKENGNFGTDHGRYAPMFVFGNSVSAGVIGSNVNLTEATSNNNWQLTTLQYDYRQILTTLLQDWLGGCDDVLSSTLYDNTNQEDFLSKKLAIVDTNKVVDPTCYIGGCYNVSIDEIKTAKNINIYPNPAQNFITLDLAKSKLNANDLIVTIYDNKGIMVQTLRYNTGNTIDVSTLSKGVYTLSIRDNKNNFLSSNFLKR